MSNCTHPIREIVDRVKIVDAKGIHEYDNVKCMFCEKQWKENKNLNTSWQTGRKIFLTEPKEDA